MKKLSIVMLFLFELSSAQMPNLLKDISPGSASSKIYDFYTLPNNDILFIATATPSTQTGIYKSDGSTAGTIMLRNLQNCSPVTPYLSKNYFLARSNGHILWRTDGTVSGTDSILTPSLAGGSSLSQVNNLLFFAGVTNFNSNTNKSLWRSDGTSAGTFSLVDNSYSGLKFFNTVNNTLLFSVTSSSLGGEMWRSDGTNAGTFMLKDIWAGAGTSNPIELGIYNNMMFFLASDPINGRELWRTDGTAGGTILLKDIFPGTAGSGIQKIMIANNGVYFYADNSINGSELWFSDGTSTNTQMVADLTPGNGSSTSVGPLVLNNNDAFFYFSNKIYKTNGSVITASLSSAPSYTLQQGESCNLMDSKPLIYNNELYYFTRRNSSWSGSSDSLILNKASLNLTLSAQVFNTEFVNNIFATQTAYAEIINSRVLFYNTLSWGNFELILYNLNNNQLKKYPSLGINHVGGPNTTIYYNKLVGNKLYFPHTLNDIEPAYIDFSKDSIVQLKNIEPTGSAYICANSSSYMHVAWRHEIFSLGNKHYFTASNTNYGVEFYETDFTPTGTFLLKDIYPGSTGFFSTAGGLCPSYFVYQTSNNIYFLANEGSNGDELWSFINSPNNPPPPPPTTTTSINEDLYFTQGLNIFPNPVERTLNVESTENIKDVLIFNALGEVVKNTHIQLSNTSAQIDLQNISNGIYFARITTNKGQLTKKFIKGD